MNRLSSPISTPGAALQAIAALALKSAAFFPTEQTTLLDDRPCAPTAISDQEMHAGILDCLPKLRAFAHLLARDHAFAEDLVQDTVVRALTCRHQFKPGTNLQGWLTVILRNRYFNELRRHSRKSECQIDLDWVAPGISGGQEENLHMRDFKRAFATLAPTHREALILVGASGLSYQEAAAIAGCRTGTMKSRVSRARANLEKALNGEAEPEPTSEPALADALSG